jgi:hypothetical protein
MVGLKLLSGLRIFLHFFSACTLISVICLYSLMIIAQSQPGEGYPQYCVILSTASILSKMRKITNRPQTIALYLLTDGCWDVTRRPLTGWHILYLNSPRREQVEILKQKLLWSPGLSTNVSMHKLTIFTSGDLYAPSMGDLPAGCVYGAFGPQHLWENPSISVPWSWSCPYRSLWRGWLFTSITSTILSPAPLHSLICLDKLVSNKATGSVCNPLD